MEVHRRAEVKISPDANRRMADGNRIGEIARSVFDPEASGCVVDIKENGVSAAIEKTAVALLGRKPVFEAGFRVSDTQCFVDVLLPSDNDDDPSWRLIEVKSSTKPKKYHIEDIAIQAHIIEQSGIRLSTLELAHVDSDWTYRGDEDYQGLLKTVDLTDDAQLKNADVAAWVAEARGIISERHPPAQNTGKHCKAPHECAFLKICGAEQSQAVFPVSSFAGVLHKEIQAQLLNNPALDMRDVDDNFLNPLQRRIKAATISGDVYFNQSAAAAELETHKFPLYFLDFETIQFVVPIWAGTKPYQQIPFQFSLHRLDALDTCEHIEFLDVSGNDPSRAFAEKLSKSCGDEGAIFVYNASFEKSRVRELADRHSDLASSLLVLNERMVDLHPIAKQYFYHPSQEGSWSIKCVLPAMCPDLTDAYKNLDAVQNGTMAMEAYATAITMRNDDPAKVKITKQLKAYCRLDTWAMVRIWEALTGKDVLAFSDVVEEKID